MNNRTLGKTEITLSPVIMGTWQAGKDMWVGIDDRDTERAIKTGIEHGITTIDTARAYGGGHSERVVGRAVKGIREDVVIATKVFADQLTYRQVKQSCHDSLDALRTDYIDLLQIHWPSGSFGYPKTPIDETMTALNDLLAEDKIRAIGVSNFSKSQISEAMEFGEIASLQPPYSLFWRQIEPVTTAFCAENDITLLAYSPLAQGMLTGKFEIGHSFEEGDHRKDNRLFQPEHHARAIEAISQLRPIADSHDATLGQLALAWVLHQGNTCAIAGARNALQTAQNAAAVDIALSASELSSMDRIGRIVTDHLDSDWILWDLESAE